MENLTIYLIGVPAAGKTTLIHPLAQRLRSRQPQLRIGVVTEVARELVLHEQVSPADIKAGTAAAMGFQRQILETQMQREFDIATSADVVLSDRSGLDPIVFVAEYGSPDLVQSLLESSAWIFLWRKMQRSLVVLCEPHPEWFRDDGVRVILTSAADMNELHATFMKILQSQDIPFEILPTSMSDLEQRVDLVANLFEKWSCPAVSV